MRARDLVLVLLVVLELDQPLAGDRLRDRRARRPSRRRPAARPAGPAPSGPRRAPRRSSCARRRASPRGCARRSGRSPRPAPSPRPAAAARGGRSCRCRARGRPRSRRLLLDLGVEDVGAAAEVDDVEHADVLAQLLLADLQSLADLGNGHALAAAAGLDQDARRASRGGRSAPGGSPPRRGPLAVAPCGALDGAPPARRLPPSAALAPRRAAAPPRGSSRSALEPAAQLAASSGGPTSRALTPRPSTHETRLRGVGVARHEQHVAVLARPRFARPRARPDRGSRRSGRSAVRSARRCARRSGSAPRRLLAQLPVGAVRVGARVEVLRGGGSRARPWSHRRPCRGSARAGRRGSLRARASGPAGRTARPGTAGGRGRPCGASLVALHRVVVEDDRLVAEDRRLDLRQARRELVPARRGRDAERDGALLGRAQRAGTAPGDLLQREPQGLGVGEFAVEQVSAVCSAASSLSVNSIAGRWKFSGRSE